MKQQNKILNSRNLTFLFVLDILCAGVLTQIPKTKLQVLGATGLAAAPMLGLGAVIAQENEPDDDPRMDDVEKELAVYRARRKKRGNSR